MNGSWTLPQIGDAAEAKRAEKAAEETRARRACSQRAEEGGDEAASPVQALVAAYTRCRPICGCGKSPCPMAKATRCPTCSKISEKGRPCIKQVYAQARRMPDAAAAGAPATAAPLIHRWSRPPGVPTGYRGSLLTLFPRFRATAKCVVATR